MKALKVSLMDAVAREKRTEYPAARETVLTCSHAPLARWYCVRADRKKRAHLAILAHLVERTAAPAIATQVGRPDPERCSPSRRPRAADTRA